MLWTVYSKCCNGVWSCSMFLEIFFSPGSQLILSSCLASLICNSMETGIGSNSFFHFCGHQRMYVLNLSFLPFIYFPASFHALGLISLACIPQWALHDLWSCLRCSRPSVHLGLTRSFLKLEFIASQAEVPLVNVFLAWSLGWSFLVLPGRAAGWGALLLVIHGKLVLVYDAFIILFEMFLDFGEKEREFTW